MSDILIDQIELLQKQYLKVLKSAQGKINENTFCAIVTEILSFWTKRKQMVFHIIEYYVKSIDTFIFTGATMIDIDNYEHYPFLAVGKKHILDDPLCRYFQVSSGTADDISNVFVEQAKQTLDDNIKVIEQCFPNIIILPLRFILNEDEEAIKKGSMDAFLSIFDDNISTLDDYKKLTTIEDISNHLIPNVAPSILFDQGEDTTKDLVYRFKEFVKQSNYPDQLKNNENHMFWITVFGHISQALSILTMSIICGCVPYIRYEVAFKYTMRLSNNFNDIPTIKEVVYKCCVAYTIYQCFNKDKFMKLGFNTYVQLLKYNNSVDNIFERLEKKGINFQNPKLSEIIDSVKDYLNELVFPDE